MDWGDGTSSEWSKPCPQGKEINYSYAWEQKGMHIIKFKVKDNFGIESDWSDPLIVTTMVRNKIINQLIPRFFEILFERFPRLIPSLS